MLSVYLFKNYFVIYLFLFIARKRREVNVCEDDEVVADSNCECPEGSSVGNAGVCVADACKYLLTFNL